MRSWDAGEPDNSPTQYDNKMERAVVVGRSSCLGDVNEGVDGSIEMLDVVNGGERPSL